MERSMATKVFSFDLKLEKGPILKPYLFEVKPAAKDHKQEKPLKYFSDILASLSFYNLNKSLGNETTTTLENAVDVWRSLEASYEMYGRSRKRVLSLHEQAVKCSDDVLKNFEKKFDACLKDIFKKDKVNLKDLYLVNDMIDYLEDHLRKPLLFNFSASFSAEFQQRLLFLYSFLWNIRSLVAFWLRIWTMWNPKWKTLSRNRTLQLKRQRLPEIGLTVKDGPPTELKKKLKGPLPGRVANLGTLKLKFRSSIKRLLRPSRKRKPTKKIFRGQRPRSKN
jgi:hypothetical protein